MIAIEIVIARPRRWQALIIARLRQAGHPISVVRSETDDAWPPLVEAILGLEARVFQRGADRLAALAVIASVASVPLDAASLRLDLTGIAGPAPIPTLSLAFDGSPSPIAALAALAGGRLPELVIWRDGKIALAHAAPMVDSRFSVARGLDDILARAVTLMLATVARFEAGTLAPLERVQEKWSHFSGSNTRPLKDLERVQEKWSHFSGSNTRPVLASYVFSALPRIAGEGLRRLRYRQAHWRVGYRFIDGPGVAESGQLGKDWSILHDDGSHFYADPFPFEWQGRPYIFVEDFPHTTGKAVIAVAELRTDGRFDTPRPVLEEPWHLSYPQVFERDGALWMLPEASGGGNLTLYRCERFPDRWVRESVLVENRELSDATLLDHGGRLWLFATDRDGYGSTSDTLVVFYAEKLAGPWRPHRLNPIRIDRAAARPGGAFIRFGNRIILPLQDGTLGYGGGLGLAELLALDENTVALGEPTPIATGHDWPYPQLHTLNRAGRLEVIDGISAVRRR